MFEDRKHKTPARAGYQCSVRLLRSELVYDIDFISWKVARCRVFDNAEARAETQTDAESSDWVDRQISTAVGMAKSTLGVYVHEPPMRMQTDEVDSPQEWDIILLIEPGWRGNISVLQSFLHQYVVNYVLSEWFAAVAPNESAYYRSLADDFLRRSRMCVRNTVINDVRFSL